MSTSQTQAPAALPSAAVDRLFARFVAIYGAQKMAGAWANVDPIERCAVWSEALGRFDLQAIGDAVRELAEDGTGWPPTLPEFVAMVQAQRAPVPAAHRPALPVPNRTAADLAAGRAQMDRLKAMLGGALRRQGSAGPSREPGSDDEPLPASAAPAACRCWVGLVRSPTLCESCSAFRRNRATMDSLRDGTAERMAEQLRDAA